MNTGSRDERTMLANIERIASATERIARTLEHLAFGATVEDVRMTTAKLAEDMRRQATQETEERGE